jgi:voltage-dependent potassium channel beta subunit
MEYRRLGSAGIQVSALSYGAWVTFGTQIGEDTAYELMKTAYEAGVNFFDNAEAYAGGQAEIIMGKVIKRTGWKRSDLVLSTKIFWGGSGPNETGLSRKHIIEGVDAALIRLQTEYVDLVFAHRPDIHTPIEETVRAFNQVINQGKAFYWGTSEWSASQIMEAYAVARREHLIPPQMEQPQYHMFHRERVESEYAHLYDEIGLGTTIWSPLASGLLSGKYNQGMPDGTRATLKGYEWLRTRFENEEAVQRIAKVGNLMNIADELNASMAQLALAWTLKNPHISSTITGSSKPEQIVENMKALDVVPQLTNDVMEKIEGILGNKPSPPQDFR